MLHLLRTLLCEWQKHHVILLHRVCFWKLIQFFSSTKQISERDQKLNVFVWLDIVKIWFEFNYCTYLRGIQEKKCSWGEEPEGLERIKKRNKKKKLTSVHIYSFKFILGIVFFLFKFKGQIYKEWRTAVNYGDFNLQHFCILSTKVFIANFLPITCRCNKEIQHLRNQKHRLHSSGLTSQ